MLPQTFTLAQFVFSLDLTDFILLTFFCVSFFFSLSFSQSCCLVPSACDNLHNILRWQNNSNEVYFSHILHVLVPRYSYLLTVFFFTLFSICPSIFKWQTPLPMFFVNPLSCGLFSSLIFLSFTSLFIHFCSEIPPPLFPLTPSQRG